MLESEKSASPGGIAVEAVRHDGVRPAAADPHAAIVWAIQPWHVAHDEALPANRTFAAYYDGIGNMPLSKTDAARMGQWLSAVLADGRIDRVCVADCCAGDVATGIALAIDAALNGPEAARRWLETDEMLPDDRVFEVVLQGIERSSSALSRHRAENRAFDWGAAFEMNHGMWHARHPGL